MSPQQFELAIENRAGLLAIDLIDFELVEIGDASVSSDADKEAIHTEFQGNIAKLRACYRKERATNPKLLVRVQAGRMDRGSTIGGIGGRSARGASFLVEHVVVRGIDERAPGQVACVVVGRDRCGLPARMLDPQLAHRVHHGGAAGDQLMRA